MLQNCGNYHSFGDTKFIPELSPDDFKKLVRLSPEYKDFEETVDKILNEVEFEVFTEEEPFNRIGFRDENKGTTSYYSSNITKEEAKMIDEWCQEIKVSPLNTRLFKFKENEYELRVASQIEGKNFQNETFTKEGKTLQVRLGDFSNIMGPVVDYMRKALAYTSNDNQKKMV